MVCIKDIELNLKIINERLIKDCKEDEIKKTIEHLIKTGANVTIGLYNITCQMERNGQYEIWKVIGLEIEIAKFLQIIEKIHIIDGEPTDEEDAFIAMLRAVYTMCARYCEIFMAIDGKIIIGNEIIEYTNKHIVQPKELPKELNTDEFKRIYKKAIDVGLCNESYEWLKTDALLAYFAGSASDALKLGKGEYSGKLKKAWKPFETLFGIKGLCGKYEDYDKKSKCPLGYEDVDSLFE